MANTYNACIIIFIFFILYWVAVSSATRTRDGQSNVGKAVWASACAVNVNKMGTVAQNVNKNCIMMAWTKLSQQGQNSHNVAWNYKVSSYFSRPGEMNEPYVTGYMVPYSDRNWEDWFQRFTLQTGCEYTIHSGKQSNTQSRETGVMKTEGKLFIYTSAWSHAYSCLRGDTGQFKSLCLEKKNRSSLGTRRFGCKTNLQVWILNVSNGVQGLEIQIPMMSAHLPAHNPSSVTDQLTMKPLPQIEEKNAELVQESFLNQRALRLSLKTWVEELIPKHLNKGVITSKPSDYNQAYYPTAEDIRVMVKKAIAREWNSLFDQEAVLQLLKEEQARNGLKYYCRQYSKCDKRVMKI